MRKLSTLVLLAFMAAPAFCFAANGPADTAPETNVIWIAVGNTPMAVEAVPAMEMVTICYFGVTITVREKIAKRYLRIGARCGACGEDGPILIEAAAPSGVCGDGPIIWVPTLAPKAISTEKVVQIGETAK